MNRLLPKVDYLVPPTYVNNYGKFHHNFTTMYILQMNKHSLAKQISLYLQIGLKIESSG